MSMGVNGITWATNIYQMFESMCLEVEDLILQDTVKFVEDQVQTVGSSVKKFYSDVMDDLLPSNSLVPENVVTSEVLLEKCNDADVSKKPEEIIKKEPLKVDIFQLRKRSKAPVIIKKNHAAATLAIRTNGVENSSPSHSPSVDSPSVFQGEFISFSLLGAGQASNQMIKDSAEIAETVSSGKTACLRESLARNSEIYNQENPPARLASSGSSQWEIPGESKDATETGHAAVPDIPVQGLSSLTRLSGFELAQESGTGKSLSSSEGFTTLSGDVSWDKSTFSSGASSLNECFCSDVNNDDLSNSGHGAIDSSGQANLEESCIIVNQEELQSVAVEPRKSCSYKKSFWDALYCRKRGSRAQDHKQLAAEFTANKKSFDEDGPISETSCPSEKSSLGSHVQESGESEWELL